MDEATTHRSILSYLRIVLPKDATGPWHTPNGGLRNKIIASQLKAMGVEPGVEDLSFVWMGKYFALEVKTKRGKLSAAQKKRAKSLNLSGAKYAVVRSIEDVDATLFSWGVISKNYSSEVNKE